MVFTDDRLYACGEEGGNVAGRVRWDPRGKIISWFMPGGRLRAFEVKAVITNTEEQFAFVDRQGRKHVMFVLTPDYYNEHIRMPRQPRYETFEALKLAYDQSLQ